jgi:hypothetical protein
MIVLLKSLAAKKNLLLFSFTVFNVLLSLGNAPWLNSRQLTRVLRPTFFIAIFLTVSLVCLSQKIVLVSGSAFDTTKGRNPVQIVLNDTLRKWRESKASTANDLVNLIKNGFYVVHTSGDGKFYIRGRLTDSLYFSSFRHITKAYCIADLLKMKKLTINLKPEVGIPLVCNDSLPAKLYAFVAEKISLTYVTRSNGSWDAEYIGEYRVVENVYGHFPKDTIRFTGFTHGSVSLNNFKHVLLFVGEYCGKLYHEKYQFFDVYKTVKGKWASPGDPYRFDNMVEQKNIKAQVVQFADSLSFDTRTYRMGQRQGVFPEEYFSVEGNKATPLKGTYVKELLTVKKEGTLKRKITQE